MIKNNAIDPEISLLYSPAKAYWNQRSKLLSAKDKILKLYQALNDPVNLSLAQWGQLLAFALDVELGRGFGNSTCVFTEMANLVKPHACKVLSLCKSGAWQKRTVPRLNQIVDKSWFAPLDALKTDICKFNFKAVLENQSRIFVFWDAHGYDLAECVLGTILPAIADKPHIVVMHDLSDMRYYPEPAGNYRLWRGNNDEGVHVQIGNIGSAVEQAISVMDFSTRNKLVVHSADHSLRVELSNSQKAQLGRLLGNELFSLKCHWFWFSLNESAHEINFPVPGTIKQKIHPQTVIKSLLGRYLIL